MWKRTRERAVRFLSFEAHVPNKLSGVGYRKIEIQMHNRIVLVHTMQHQLNKAITISSAYKNKSNTATQQHTFQAQASKHATPSWPLQQWKLWKNMHAIKLLDNKHTFNMVVSRKQLVHGVAHGFILSINLTASLLNSVKTRIYCKYRTKCARYARCFHPCRNCKFALLTDSIPRRPWFSVLFLCMNAW